MRQYLRLLSLILTIGCRPDIHYFTGRQPMVRLASGDSIRFVATGPVIEPGGDTGWMYEYHPFFSLDDSIRLHTQVLELWKLVRPRAESLRVPFVVLRATTRFTELPVTQPTAVRNFGFVLQKRANGLWYFLYDSVPVNSQ
jgi:hypothetical protein